jgi:DNA-binding NarL/FixJ family response regulator
LASRTDIAIGQLEREREEVVLFDAPRLAITAVMICDDPMWEHALSWLAGSLDVQVVGRGHDVHRAPELVNRFEPTLLLIEAEDVDPADLYRRLRQTHKAQPSIRSIVICGPEEAALRDAALAGVVSLENAAELVEAIDVARSLRDEPPSSRPRLTRRELEILRLVARGRTNHQVAQMIWVTDQTVKYHLANVYRKLGVRNRAEAVEWAIRSGLSDRGPVPTGR